MNIVKPVIKKIPGEIPPEPKKASQGYIDDLGKKQKFELIELLERQEKLLANKKFVSKLPDKGAKILEFKGKIARELETRDKVEEAAKLLSRLNIVSEGKAAISEMEWTGKYNDKPKNNQDKIVEMDSDDEEDPLKILAQPTGSGAHKKKIIHLAPEESLIKPEDLEEIESFKTLDPLESEHIKYIIDKVENNENKHERKQYKPYKTTKSNVHDPEKEKQRDSKKTKHWEVTAATPPSIIHEAAKTLDLNESLRLQKEYAIKLKEVQARHAVERLTQQLGVHQIGTVPRNIGSYRTNDRDNSDSSNSEDEENYPPVYDDEDNDKAGTVTFTVDSVNL
ncbi:hypothetical protein TSAR_014582 [Trichomalopsis sarcophagae]|uniref:Uncharacterized protein n=1 Tax=Trichomalopsis sarcophagae TaxID=543379 RepID=A0A232F026_9HYME|nr:hypothetical protein TSAR_014582 [Trichomalopsis sarcophagae]